MTNPIDVVVGKNLRERRIAAGLSQDQLGKAVGLTFQQIQKYEKGTNRMSASRLAELAVVLKVNIIDLFVGVAQDGETEARTLAEARNDQKALEAYTLLEPDVQEALRNLMQAITISVGAKMREVHRGD